MKMTSCSECEWTPRFSSSAVSCGRPAGKWFSCNQTSQVVQPESACMPLPVGGGMHADSGCTTCEVWLHENHFPAGRPQLTAEEEKRGVHSHSEHEVIFITDGQIRLGNKLYGPGTAVAIAADTLYSFTPGPEGLSFINFRAGTPGDIQFANGMAISETGYWRDRQMKPEYVTPR